MTQEIPASAIRPALPCWRYRKAKDGSTESRLFPDISNVPADEGWTDSPASLAAPAPAKKEKAK